MGPRIRRHRTACWALGAYLVIGFALLARTWLAGRLDSRVVGVSGDPWGFVWFLSWLPHALEAGQWPLFTKLAMAPQGANLLASTSIALPSLLLAPITLLFGATVSYDLLANLALGFSAWTAYLAIARLTNHRSAAFLGGAMYGFGGYMAGQSLAHVNLIVGVFPPLAAMLIDNIRREVRPLASGLILGAAAVAQIFINEEVLATTAVLLVLGAALAVWRVRPSRLALTAFLRPAAAALGVLVLLAGPFLVYQFFGPQHVSKLVVGAGRYVNDVTSFVVPNRTTLLHSTGAINLTDRLSGHDGEYGGYLGIPLICLLAWAVVRLRRRALAPALLVGVAALFSLGPHLRVDGHDTGVLLPWVIPNHLPILQDVVPDRFNLFIWLGAAVLVAMLVDGLQHRPATLQTRVGWVAVAIAVLSIVPLPTPSTQLMTPRLTTVALSRPGRVPTVLVVPLLNGQLGMYAQARDGFSYAIPEGGLSVPGPGAPAYGMRNGPLLYALSALDGTRSTRAGRTPLDYRCLAALGREPPLPRPCRSLYLSALRSLDVTAVAVIRYGSTPTINAYARFFAGLLGPARSIRGAFVFNVEP